MRNIPWKTKSSLFRLIDFLMPKKPIPRTKYLTKVKKELHTIDEDGYSIRGNQ